MAPTDTLEAAATRGALLSAPILFSLTRMKWRGGVPMENWEFRGTGAGSTVSMDMAADAALDDAALAKDEADDADAAASDTIERDEHAAEAGAKFGTKSSYGSSRDCIEAARCRGSKNVSTKKKSHT